MLGRLMNRLLPLKSSPSPRRATRLTIVGGRPPSEVEAPPFPEGIERALRRAATDRSFRHRLLADRASALTEMAHELTPTELAVLTATPHDQLERMIDEVAPLMPARRGALVRLAAALGIVLGGTALSHVSCGLPSRATEGARADVPPPNSAGIQPDEPTRTRGISPDTPVRGRKGQPRDVGDE